MFSKRSSDCNLAALLLRCRRKHAVQRTSASESLATCVSQCDWGDTVVHSSISRPIFLDILMSQVSKVRVMHCVSSTGQCHPGDLWWFTSLSLVTRLSIATHFLFSFKASKTSCRILRHSVYCIIQRHGFRVEQSIPSFSTHEQYELEQVSYTLSHGCLIWKMRLTPPVLIDSCSTLKKN